MPLREDLGESNRQRSDAQKGDNVAAETGAQGHGPS